MDRNRQVLGDTVEGLTVNTNDDVIIDVFRKLGMNPLVGGDLSALDLKFSIEENSIQTNQRGDRCEIHLPIPLGTKKLFCTLIIAQMIINRIKKITIPQSITFRCIEPRNTRALIVGVGGIGSTLYQTIYPPPLVIDRGIVKVTDLNRTCFSHSDLGEYKAAVLGGIVGDVTTDDLYDIFSGQDVIFSCVDNEDSRIAAYHIARQTKTQLIDVGVTGDGNHIAIKDYTNDCLICLYKTMQSLENTTCGGIITNMSLAAILAYGYFLSKYNTFYYFNISLLEEKEMNLSFSCFCK